MKIHLQLPELYLIRKILLIECIILTMIKAVLCKKSGLGQIKLKIYQKAIL